MPEKRICKVNKHGNTAYSVVLPASWCRYYKIKNGKTLEMIVFDEGILLRPITKPKREEEIISSYTEKLKKLQNKRAENK